MRGLRAIVAGLCLFHIGLFAQFVRVDTSFFPLITGGGVACIAVQPDQKILIGGGFTNVNGIERRGLARLNADGSLDESFEVHWLGPQPSISSLELYNTNVYVATYGEWLVVPCHPIPATTPNQALRLSMDGAVERRYVLGARFIVDSHQRLIWGNAPWACYRYGPAVVAYYEADNTNGCSATLATLDCLYPLNNYQHGGVYAISRQVADGIDKVLIGGHFGHVNSNEVHAFARLDSDGSLDGSFQGGSDEPITAVAVDSQNRIFTGSWKGGIQRRLIDGSLDTNFIFIRNDSGQEIRKLVPDENGGVFNIRGTTLTHFEATGALDTNFLVQAGNVSSLPYWTPEWVSAVAVQIGKGILIGGSFTNVNCASQSYLARLIPSEQPDPTNCFLPPLPPPKPYPQLEVARINGSKMVCCWPTNYPEFNLQATKRLRPNHPEKEKWVTVTNLPVQGESTVCVTNRILRWGRHYRLSK